MTEPYDYERDRLYSTQKVFVFRIFDPIEQKFCCSGRSLYAGNGRSIWAAKSGATVTIKNLPADVRDRVVIKKFQLVEVE